ncbi:hypothetical protein KFE25_004001 [Diacronema lutheri]|uniref:AMP-dependent synthetase/ligase domain-containing protein n=2 Tax=Diacronema lutheri TaxID=2081491 RepID=A0A8J5XBV7_DIALT|nr:hypothetical protein KFE25_004001 [Diacronema lutheri]
MSAWEFSDLLDERAQLHPGAVAVRDGAHVVAFGELRAASCSCAAALSARGVARGHVVALVLPRSAASVAWLFAIWRVGAIYLPIEHGSPTARVDELVRHARAKLVVGLAAGAGAGDERMVAACLRVVCELASPSCEPRRANELPLGCCYVMYTSGSTGAPKGVLGTAAGLMLRCRWAWRARPFDGAQREVVAHKTSIGFVDHLAEVCGALLAGCQLTVLPDALLRDSSALLRALAAERVSRIVVVPTLLCALLRACERAASDGAQRAPCLPAMRLVACSGDSLPAALCARFVKLMPVGCALLNLYGCTEVSADVTVHDATVSPAPSTAIVPLGTPLEPCVLIALLAVPDGDEICVGGAYVALGYLDEPQLTSERFVTVRLAELERLRRLGRTQGGERVLHSAAAGGAVTLFRTGDLGRLDQAGLLHHMGRMDDQLKIGGVRLEPREVEAAILTDVRVQHAAALAWAPPAVGTDGSGGGDTMLVAFVVASMADVAGAEANGAPALVSTSASAAQAGDGFSRWAELRSDLRRRLERTLPAHAVPSHIFRVEHLPLTQSGKVDRRQLREQLTPRLTRSPGATATHAATHAASASSGGRGGREQAADAASGSNAGGEGGHCADALRALVRELVRALSPELAAQATVAGDETAVDRHASIDCTPLRAAGLTSLSSAQLVHALWRSGWLLPMETLLRDDCTVNLICEHARAAGDRASGSTAAAAAPAAAPRRADDGAMDEADWLERIPRAASATSSLAALAQWRFDAGTAAPSLPPVALASAEALAVALPYFALPSTEQLAGALQGGTRVRWWARANDGPDVARAGVWPVGAAPSLLGAWRWRSAKCVDASPLVVLHAGTHDPRVYIGSHSGEFACLEMASGAVRWVCTLPDRIESSAAVALGGALVLVGCYDGCVYALHTADGQVAWRHATGGEVKASPCVAIRAWAVAPSRAAAAAGEAEGLGGAHAVEVEGAETVWCGSFDQHLYALDARTGTCLLRLALGAAIFSSALVVAAPHPDRAQTGHATAHAATDARAEARGGALLVCCATLKGRVVAIDAVSHDPHWSAEVGHAVFAALRADASAGVLLVASVDGHLRALELASGAVRWACDTGGPIFATPCVHHSRDAQHLYFASSQAGHVVCADGLGRVRWRARCPGVGGHSAPSSSADLLVIGRADGHLCVLCVSSGAQLCALQLSGAVHSSPVLCAALSAVVVGCRDECVYCFKLAAPATPLGSCVRVDASDVLAAPPPPSGDGARVTESAAGGDDSTERARKARLLVLSRVLGNLGSSR